MIALALEIKAPEDIKVVEIDGADGEVIRDGFEDGAVVFVGIVRGAGVEESGGEAIGFEIEPAISVGFARFLDAGLGAFVILMEIDHVGVEALHAFKEGDDGGAVGGHFHLGAEAHVDVKLIAEGGIGIGH